jgi:hypothetical protein
MVFDSQVEQFFIELQFYSDCTQRNSSICDMMKGLTRP